MANLTFDKHVSGFLNFTYQDAIGKNLITNLRRHVPGVAKVKGNAGVLVRVAELFNVNLVANWVGKRQVPLTDPYGPVDGYVLANLVFTTEKFFDRRVYASINIHNLFNTRFLDPGFRSADGLLYSTVLEQPGINGLFKIGVHL